MISENNSISVGGVPTGTVISYMGNRPPKDYLICDGATYNIADYPALAQHFEDQFDAKNYFGGDGTTTFKVPDLRGEFLRGAGTNSHSNQGSGGNVGAHQNATEHFTFQVTASSSNLVLPRGNYTDALAVTNKDKELKTYTSGTKVSSWTGGVTTQSYTDDWKYASRPTNTSILYCIHI